MVKQPKKKQEKKCHPVESGTDGGVVVNTDPTPINKCPRGYYWNGTRCVADLG
jgi:hypothetical protein